MTGVQLGDAIESPLIDQIMTDYWGPYEHFVLAEKHIQSQAEAFPVEGSNSLFRHFLERLCRIAKCYSKSVTMLEYLVMLLMAKQNGESEYI